MAPRAVNAGAATQEISPPMQTADYLTSAAA